MDLSHIIPKCYRKSFTKGELDGPDNIIPTFPALHRQMELYQHRPSISFKFWSRDDENYDWYEIKLSHEVNKSHILNRYIMRDKVRLHRASRKHLRLHFLVFKECEDTIKPTGNDWTQTLQELNCRHAVTGILRSIFGAIRNAKIGIKTVEKGVARATAPVIQSWLESGEVVVSGELWDYESDHKNEEETHAAVRCKILKFHEKRQNLELLCYEDYAEDDVEYFLKNYNARAGVLKRSLANFQVWKVSVKALMPHVIQVGQDDSFAWIQVQEEIPTGTIFHNFVDDCGFALMEVASYEDSSKLCRVKVLNSTRSFDDLEFTISQIQNLVSGDIFTESAQSRLLNKCVVVKSTETGENFQLGKLLKVERGYAEVQWLRESAVLNRRQNSCKKSYYPAYLNSKWEIVAARKPCSKSWRPFKCRLPISHLWGKPFELVDAKLPYDVASMATNIDLTLSTEKRIGSRALRNFDGDELEGAVCAYFPESDEGVELFHIAYIDGDSEDLTSLELDKFARRLEALRTKDSEATEETFKVVWKSVEGVERKYIGRTFVDITLHDTDEFKTCTVVDVVQDDVCNSKFFRYYDSDGHSNQPSEDLLETTPCEEFPPFKSSGSDFEWTPQRRKRRRMES